MALLNWISIEEEPNVGLGIFTYRGSFCFFICSAWSIICHLMANSRWHDIESNYPQHRHQRDTDSNSAHAQSHSLQGNIRREIHWTLGNAINQPQIRNLSWQIKNNYTIAHPSVFKLNGGWTGVDWPVLSWQEGQKLNKHADKEIVWNWMKYKVSLTIPKHFGGHLAGTVVGGNWKLKG